MCPQLFNPIPKRAFLYGVANPYSCTVESGRLRVTAHESSQTSREHPRTKTYCTATAEVSNYRFPSTLQSPCSLPPDRLVAEFHLLHPAASEVVPICK